MEKKIQKFFPKHQNGKKVNFKDKKPYYLEI